MPSTPLILPVGYAEHTISFLRTGDPTLNSVTMATGCVDGVDDAAVLTYANSVFDLVKDAMCDIDKIVKWVVKSNTSSGLQEFEFAGTQTGTISTDPVPIQTAMLVKKATGIPGRAHRGRMYWPSLPETKVTGAGVLDSTFRGDMQDIFNSWFSLSDATFPQLVLLHTSDAIDPDDLTGLIVETSCATQRRRLTRP